MPVLGKFDTIAGLVGNPAGLPVRETLSLGQDAFRNGSVPVERRMCGAPDCASGWHAPWKSRRRPIFEQAWGCSQRCVSTLVDAAVRRESGDGMYDETSEPHRHRVPLGLVLLAQGWITHPQLQSALAAQRASGRGRIGDWLSQSCGLPETRITRGLGVQWNCPVLGLDGFSPRSMAVVMPKRLIAEFGMIPLRVAGSSLLYLAFEERMDAGVALGCERMSGLKAESALLSGSHFEAARSAVLAADGVPVQMKLVADRDALTAGIVRALDERHPIATRLVRIHQYYWVRMWLESGALRGVGNLPAGPDDVVDYLFLIGQKAAAKS